MRRQVETWQRTELTVVTAKVVIYEAFVEGKLEVPKYLARMVQELYFERGELFWHDSAWSERYGKLQTLRPSMVG